MRPLNAYLFLLILGLSFSKCFTIPTFPPGFGTGAIDLGGLVIHQIKNFTEVWRTHEGGPNNVGATFYEPSSIPDGFYMLGSYSNSNIKPLPGWVLVGKDSTNDNANGILKPPIDYSLVLNSTSLAIDQNATAYIWLPTPPVGYVAVGNVVTGSSEKPPLDKIRCVRNDFVVVQENGNWIWGGKVASVSNSFNLYSSITEGGGNKTDPLVPTGTFFVQSNGSTTSSVSYLKNVGGIFSAMPNLTQIDELIKQYSPVIYFHPDEQFFPASVSWFFENGGLLIAKEGNSNPVPINPTGSNLPQGGENDGLYWLDMPQDDAIRNNMKKGNLEGATAYIHIKPSVGATCTDIVVFIFYPYNGPGRAKIEFMNINFKKIGEHIGDWEHVTLRINNFNGELKRVYLSQHSKGAWVDESEIEYQNGKKPVVYSSLNGHSSFNKPGVNMLGGGNIGIRNDAAKGKMFDIGMNYTIVSADYLKPPIVEPFWLNYARKWGPEIRYDISDELSKFSNLFGPLKKKITGLINGLPKEIMGQEGPIGPKWKDSWDGDERV